MGVRLRAPGSVTAELYHGGIVEGAEGPGRGVQGPRAQAERKKVRDRAEFFHLVFGKRRAFPAKDQAAGRLSDAQEQAGLEAALDVLGILRFPRTDAWDFSQAGPLGLAA